MYELAPLKKSHKEFGFTEPIKEFTPSIGVSDLAKIPSKFNSLTDAQPHEIIPIAMLVISILFVGIYPAFISDIFTLGLEPIVASVEAIN